MEVLFNEVAAALVQQPEFAEGKVIEITSALDEVFSKDRTGDRAGDFGGFGLPLLTIAGEYSVPAFDHVHREVFKVQSLAADNRRQPGFVYACAQQEIDSGFGADDLGPEAFGNEWDVTDMIGVTVAGEDVVGAANNIQDRLFVGFPFFRRDRLLACKKGIDQDLALAI